MSLSFQCWIVSSVPRVAVVGVFFLYFPSYPGTSDVSLFECLYFFYHSL